MEMTEKIKLSFIKLGLRIKELRENQNTDLKELSAKTGIRKEYLAKIEKGIAYGVTVQGHLVKIAKAFEVKLSELFDFD